MAQTAELEAFRLVSGFRASAMIRVAAQLRLPDLLSAEPRTAANLTGVVGVQSAALHRLLRGLAVLGVLTDFGDGQLALTEVGRQFEDRPGSLRTPAMVLPEQSGPSFGEIR